MSEVRSELKFLSSHEWALVDGDIATIGISDHAQNLLGDVVYVESPEVGSAVAAGDVAGVVESVKAASDTYAPVSGEVIEVNSGLEDTPELINEDPYGDGWMYRVRIEDAGEIDSLMDAETYLNSIEDE